MARDWEGKPPNGIEHGSFLSPAQEGRLDHEIRRICQEEIAKHLEMAKSLEKFAGQLMPPKPCEECAKLKHKLGLAIIALKKIAGLDPALAAQRAQAAMPVEHDIAKLTLREIRRDEDDG